MKEREVIHMYILFLFIIMNLIGFYLMKIDKKKAKLKEYRIKEKTLWLVALFFGAAGMTIGMKTYRHKTKHIQFKIGLPILALIETGIFLYFIILLS